MKKIKQWIFSGDFLYNHTLALILWFGLPVFDIVHTLCRHSKINNFIIYKSVFYHLIEQKNLYALYPLEYSDVNLYGPIFSIVIAPFALVPDYVHMFYGVYLMPGYCILLSGNCQFKKPGKQLF